MRGLVLILLAGSAQAELQPAVAKLMPYMDDLALCLDEADSREDARLCVGRYAAECMHEEEGGQSTVGMMFCTLAETEAWDRLLNETYQARMAAMREDDAGDLPEYRQRADALRDAQRGWIAFRDGECGLAYALWGSGSMRQIAGANCLRDMTAERTIALKFLGAEMRGE